MSKSLKQPCIITLISLAIPVWIVLIFQTNHIWLMVSPIWISLMYIFVNFELDKLKNKYTKHIKIFVRILLVIGVAFILYGI